MICWPKRPQLLFLLLQRPLTLTFIDNNNNSSSSSSNAVQTRQTKETALELRLDWVKEAQRFGNLCLWFNPRLPTRP